MSIRSRTLGRAFFLAVMVLSVAVVAHSAVASPFGDVVDEATGTDAPGAETESASGPPSAAPPERGVVDVEGQFAAARDGRIPSQNWSADRIRRATNGTRNVTVVATQGVSVSDERAELTAFLPNGSLLYYEEEYPVYFDVDPVPGERYTVEYVASEHLSGDDCSAFEGGVCTRNLVRRVNVTTGESETVYAEVTPRVYSARWHDVDRLNETTLVVADIVEDGVYAVDTRDGSELWRWSASENYSRDQGGVSGDWTHVNDVEVLADGRVMASVRNMDSVVFLEPSDGSVVMDDRWTLGSDDDYDTLHEQHNPDYVPPERGGPAVIVADSENRRVVEYQREASAVDGGDARWRSVWDWRDPRLQWPRDADRLSTGRTLVVDTHGDRVLEVDANGSVAWATNVGMAYDAERLGTGDESATGRAREVPETAAEDGPRSPVDRFWSDVKRHTPSLLANGLLFVAPSWIRFADLIFLSLCLCSGLFWSGLEIHWSRYSVRGVASRWADAVSSAGSRLERRLTGP